MNIPQIHKLSLASQLSLLSIVILLGAIFFTVTSAVQQQSESGHANTTTYSSIWIRGITHTVNASGSHLTLAEPSSVVAGDVLVAQVVVHGATTTITPPSGWSLIRRDNTGSDIGDALYKRVASGVDAATYTWNFNTAENAAGGIIALVNVDTSSPIDATSGRYNSSTSVMTADSVSTTTPADKLLFFGGVVGKATVTPPTGMTTQWNPSTADTTNNTTAFLAEKILTASGATGSKVATSSMTSSNISQLVALRPIATTIIPTATQAPKPTATPIFMPKPTATPVPTIRPTATPTKAPTQVPTVQPTLIPTKAPTPTCAPPPTCFQNGVMICMLPVGGWCGFGTPTPSPTHAPTATPTPIGFPPITPTLTPRPTATPTPRPTAIPVPTNTPVPGSTVLAVTVGLHGIGTGGDSANPGSLGNTSPLRPARTITADIYDVQNQLVVSQQSTINYNTATGKFDGTVDLGTSFATGLYTVKIKTDQYLRSIVPGIQSITAGQTVTLPAVTLVAGDINGDNAINIIDYNLLIGCYSDLLPATNCNATDNVLSDLTDDGHVNQFDYNLFLRELTNIGGQ